MNSGPVLDAGHETIAPEAPAAPSVDTVDRAEAPPAPTNPLPKSPVSQTQAPDPPNVIQADAPSHEGSNTEPIVSHSPAHIARALSPSTTSAQPEPVDTVMTSAPSAPNESVEAPRSPATSTNASAQQTQPPVIEARPPSYITPPMRSGMLPAHPQSAHPSPQGHVPRPSDLPLTMVQTGADGDQGLSARQLGQRARRARERELQAQGLYTPKRRTSSSATQPDLSAYTTISHAGQPSSVAPAQPASSVPPLPTPPTQATSQGDVSMQSADEDGDDDGEGELEADLPPQSVGPSVLPAPGPAPTTPAVPPHTASHLIPPIAVLAPVTTPSRASLAQRARRERERAGRLGASPNGSMSSPNGPTGSPTTLIYSTPQHPIQLNPAQQVPPGSTHLATLGQFPQQPPTLTRGQLAQRARRARERVERASKAQNTEGWTPSLSSQEGVSSAGEAVFAVAPPPPSANGTTGFATTASQHNPGYGVGLGAAHVPQQLNRAQLAQRARRARERQQRIAAAGSHASGSPVVGENSKLQHRSPSSSVPPASPTAKQHMAGTSRTSLSPMASSAAPAPAALAINAQFAQVFKSLTAGDNGVSRAVADAGALTSKDDIKGRNASNSPTAERVTSPLTSTQQGETNDMSVDEHMDQLSEDSTGATTPSRGAEPVSSLVGDEQQPPKSTPPRELTPLMNTHERKHMSPRATTPEVAHMANVQSVGA